MKKCSQRTMLHNIIKCLESAMLHNIKSIQSVALFWASLPSTKKSYWGPKNAQQKTSPFSRHFYMRGKVANWPAVHSAQAAQPSRSASECENSVSWRAVFDQQRSTRFGPQIGRILGNSIKKGKSILLVGNEQKSFHESPWSLARRSPNFVRTLLVFSLI